MPWSPWEHQQGVTLGVVPCTLHGLCEGDTRTGGTCRAKLLQRCFQGRNSRGSPRAVSPSRRVTAQYPTALSRFSAVVSCPLGRSFPRTQRQGEACAPQSLRLCPPRAPSALRGETSVAPRYRARAGPGAAHPEPRWGSPRPLPSPGIELIVFPQWVARRLGCSHGGGRTSTALGSSGGVGGSPLLPAGLATPLHQELRSPEERKIQQQPGKSPESLFPPVCRRDWEGGGATDGRTEAAKPAREHLPRRSARPCPAHGGNSASSRGEHSRRSSPKPAKKFLLRVPWEKAASSSAPQEAGGLG